MNNENCDEGGNNADVSSDAQDSPGDLSLKATAYHEAGHAVMALCLGRNVGKVSVRPGRSQFGDQRLGLCQIDKGRSKATKNALEDEILILFAGMVAESRFTGQYCEQGAAQDLRMIRRLLQGRCDNAGQVERLERRWLDKAEHLLDDKTHARAMELIAAELIKKKTISGRSVRHFYDQAEKSSWH